MRNLPYVAAARISCLWQASAIKWLTHNFVLRDAHQSELGVIRFAQALHPHMPRLAPSHTTADLTTRVQVIETCRHPHASRPVTASTPVGCIAAVCMRSNLLACGCLPVECVRLCVDAVFVMRRPEHAEQQRAKYSERHTPLAHAGETMHSWAVHRCSKPACWLLLSMWVRLREPARSLGAVYTGPVDTNP